MKNILQKPRKMTSARRSEVNIESQLADLRRRMRQANADAWAIGDMVNRLKIEHKLKVKDIATMTGASRQRLSELRRTADAFPSKSRRLDRDIHFHTVAARAARRLNLSPIAVVDEIIEKRIDSARQATRYLAERVREEETRQSLVLVECGPDTGVIDRCHHRDFRNVLPLVSSGTVKLVLADAPYGSYGKYSDGQHTRVSSTKRDCDALCDAEARSAVTDLLRLAPPKMTAGGCLILFRPGALADPPWLLNAAEQFGWACRHAVTWQRGGPKLGDGRAPYAAATERLLVFSRGSEPLVNHDGSARSDLLVVPATAKSYARVDQHLFEKPVDLMRRLVAKHSHKDELVLEPFGGTGPGCVAAVRLKRKWIYVESNRRNFELGSTRIAQELTKLTSRN
ncbi:MAG: DNA methyltransferase [Planctomycetota bacterium]